MAAAAAAAAAASKSWGGGDPAAGEWTTVYCFGRAPDAAPAPPRSGGGVPNRAPSVGEVGEGMAGVEIGGRRLDKYDMPVEVSGEGVLPPPAEGFEEAGLVVAVLRNLATCGYESPRPVQRYAIPVGVAGRDLMASAQTGSGKTAAFCLPVVSELAAEGGVGCWGRSSFDRAAGRPTALVVAPTTELAAQLCDLERGLDILVATPGRLVFSLDEYLVIDEADMMLGMGFEPQIREIVDRLNMPRKPVRQTMLFSATFPPQIQRLASDFLSNYIFITVGSLGSSTDLIMQKVELLSYGEKRGYLLDLLQKQSVGVAISKVQQPLILFFVEKKRESDSLRYLVHSKCFAATGTHEINEETKKFYLQTGPKVVVLYGGTPMYNQVRDLGRGVDMLVATPGRLVDMVGRSRVSLEAIKYLVMNEADRMLDMGFEPQIRKIVDRMNMPRKSVGQNMLFSATFPPKIQVPHVAGHGCRARWVILLVFIVSSLFVTTVNAHPPLNTCPRRSITDIVNPKNVCPVVHLSPDYFLHSKRPDKGGEPISQQTRDPRTIYFLGTVDRLCTLLLDVFLVLGILAHGLSVLEICPTQRVSFFLWDTELVFVWANTIASSMVYYASWALYGYLLSKKSEESIAGGHIYHMNLLGLSLYLFPLGLLLWRHGNAIKDQWRKYCYLMVLLFMVVLYGFKNVEPNDRNMFIVGFFGFGATILMYSIKWYTILGYKSTSRYLNKFAIPTMFLFLCFHHKFTWYGLAFIANGVFRYLEMVKPCCINSSEEHQRSV